MQKHRVYDRLVAVVVLIVAPFALLSDEEKAPAKTVSYYTDIRPIFQANCHGCHQPSKAKGSFVMTDFEKLLGSGDSGDKAIIPGNPDQSYLVELIVPVNGEAEMPRNEDPLSALEIDLIRNWIQQGAIDDTPPNAKQRYDKDNPPVYTRAPVITALDYSPDGQLLAVAGFHEVILHRADGAGIAGRLVGLSERIESVRFSPDGTRLAVTGGLPARMGEVQVWDVQKQELDLSVPVTFDTLYGASWSPDGKLIAFGCSDTTLRAIDSKTGEEVLYQSAHDDWCLDTVFSLKGDHVVSVGRDMATKLTELATQRFIDNVTSITPGALKGGLNSIARNPIKDEVVIGGADGVPQIYQAFRQTKRVIGDNANLLRRFPAMKGRIFSVDYSPDGKKIVAGSSLNGVGYLNIYSSDFDGTLSDDFKKVLEKVSFTRSKEEHAKVEAFRTKDIKQLAATSFDSSIYAVSFSSDGGAIAAAGADGVIRILDADNGSLLKAFLSVPLQSVGEDELFTLSIEPQTIDLSSRFDYAQMVVRGWTATGVGRDLTREATFTQSGETIEISDTGMVRGKKDGKGSLQVKVGALSTTIPVKVARLNDKFSPDFVRDVAPVISKLGCNAGTCHGAKDGRNGFKLSLRGYDPLFDVRAFTDDHAGRRINFASPDDSLMLLKSTAGVPHEGGQVTKPGEDYYEILKAWISEGCELNTSSPKVASIRMTPSNPVVQNTGSTQQMRIVATYADGSERDVTAEAFIESGNSEIIEAGENGLVTSVRRGEAPVLARFEGAYAATTMTVMGDRSGFEWTEPETSNEVDELVAAKWKRMKILPSGLCTDTEFIRRVYLDVTGLPPSPEAVKAFLADERETKTKRDELIDRLVGSNEYVDYWANKWADLLQVNRKFLGAEGAKIFRDWIRNEIDQNTPYDEFARKIITAQGSNKENPAAAYYKILRDPELTMENTTHLFLATRFNCNKCHDHPFERWTQDQYYETSAYFARVAFKKDPESGDKKIGGTAVEGSKPLYEVVYDGDAGEVTHLRTGETALPQFPFDAQFTSIEGASRRETLAAWMTSPDNQYFAKSYVNRLWGYLLGVGLIEPLDDIRAGNPPSNPGLLDRLTQQFIESGYDVRQVISTICKSRTYQLSVETNQWNEDDAVNYSHAYPKRLPAEVLFDSIYFTSGSIPDFPGVPRGTRALQLPDVGVKLPDGFLATLGRPPRESACECERSNDLQLGSIMSLVSGPTVDQAISDPENAIAKLVDGEKDDRKVIDELYLRILNRPATDREIDRTVGVFGMVEPQHQQLVKQLASYEKEIAPIIEQREAERERNIESATEAVAEYEAEIAPREAELDRKRDESIAKAEQALSAYEGSLVTALAAWEKKPDRASEWTALDPRQMKSSADATLILQRDRSVMASGKNGKDVYEVIAETRAKELNGIRLEVLMDESLPKNGPGRAEDGNFVLTEIELFWAPKSNPGEQKKVQLEKAKADFSQEKFGVGAAIDGNTGGGNNGWAVSPELGKNHVATFEFKEPLKGTDEGIILTVKLHQRYQSNKHSIGRFRLATTSSKKPVDFGIPDPIQEVLEVAADDRDDDQTTALLEFFRGFDPELKKLKGDLSTAKKPRPVDPELKELKDRLEIVSKPLPIDPTLKELKRAVDLSSKHIETTRLTAAQDVAWALINNPAFLFNH